MQAPPLPPTATEKDRCTEALQALPSCLRDAGTDHQGAAAEGAERPCAVIHNIVSTSVIHSDHSPIDLHELSLLLPCSSYDRRRFAAITVRIDNPKCTALLFTSGKLVVTGVKSWFECLLASLAIARLINSVMIGSLYMVINCDIQNIVAHSELNLRQGSMLNIQAMYEDMSGNCTYQKNMFPGLILRAKAPVVLLCFYSGKIVLTGGKTVDDINRGWEMLWPVVSRYIY